MNEAMQVVEFRAQRWRFVFSINRPMSLHRGMVAERWVRRWGVRNRAVVNRPSVTLDERPPMGWYTSDRRQKGAVMAEGWAFPFWQGGLLLPAERDEALKVVGDITQTLANTRLNGYPSLRVAIPDRISLARTTHAPQP